MKQTETLDKKVEKLMLIKRTVQEHGTRLNTAEKKLETKADKKEMEAVQKQVNDMKSTLDDLKKNGIRVSSSGNFAQRPNDARQKS